MLGTLDAVQPRIDLTKAFYANGDPGYALHFADQDALNAVLASRVERERIEFLDARLAPHPPFAGLRLVDEATLRCSYADGVEPFLLHHVHAKPWLAATAPNVYSRLLTRLLLADDVALRLDPDDVAAAPATGNRGRPRAAAGLTRRRVQSPRARPARLTQATGCSTRLISSRMPSLSMRQSSA